MAFVIDTDKVSSLAVELLARSIVLPGTVSRVPQGDYTGSGGTVKVRVPTRRTALQQETPGAQITFNAISEDEVDVVVSHWYDATSLADEDLTLSIEDFGRQVLASMVAAVAESGEDVLAAVMDGISPDPVLAFGASPDAAADEAVILGMREVLTQNDVPAGGRFLAVAPDIATRLLAIDKFSKVDESGSPSALRDAILGRLYGMTCVESNAIEEGSAVAYHRSGLCFATFAPAIPQGAGSASSKVSQGIALRTVFDFSVNFLTDLVAISTFGGAALVDDARVVRVVAPAESS